MESYFIAVFPEHFNGVFPPKKVKKSFVRSMKAIVVSLEFRMIFHLDFRSILFDSRLHFAEQIYP